MEGQTDRLRKLTQGSPLAFCSRLDRKWSLFALEHVVGEVPDSASLPSHLLDPSSPEETLPFMSAAGKAAG